MSLFPDKTLILSNTKMKLLNSCPRCFMKAEFRPYFDNDFQSPAALVGTLLHEAWQDWLMGKLEFSQFADRLCEDFNSQPQLVESKYYSFEGFTKAFTNGYRDLQGHSLLEVNGKPSIETSFSIEILQDNPVFDKILYVGHIDALLKTPNEEYITLDFKTTSKPIAKAQTQYDYAFQQIPYALTLQSLLDTDKTVRSEYWIYSVTQDEKAKSINSNNRFYKDWLWSLRNSIQRVTEIYQNDFIPFSNDGDYHNLYTCNPTHPTRRPSEIKDIMIGNHPTLWDEICAERAKPKDVQLTLQL